MAETVVVTGATGLIGRHLCKALVEAGHTVRSLSRSAHAHPVPEVKTFVWDIEKATIDPEALLGATVLVHLAGENLADGRWNETRRRQIWDSRIQSAALLHKAIKEADAPVHTVIGASAIGYYGPSRRPIDESGHAGSDFPAQVCKAWEQAHTFLAEGRRLVILRIGIVLSKDGGTFPRLAAPVQNWVGTWVGSGHQVMSWIHVRDVVGLTLYSIENKETEGIYNAVAHEPVSQRFFVKQLGRYLHRPIWPIGVPGWAIRLVYGEMADVILKGNHITSARLGYLNYRLRHPYLYEALGELFKKRKG